MANFLKGFGGGGDNDLAKMAGQKVGSLVEEGVKSVTSGGNKGPKKDEKKAGGGGGGGGGGFGVGDALSLVTGKKEQNKGGGGGGGFSVGDALSFVSGNKDHNKGGGSGPGAAPAPPGEHQDNEAEFSLEAGLEDGK